MPSIPTARTDQRDQPTSTQREPAYAHVSGPPEASSCDTRGRPVCLL